MLITSEIFVAKKELLNNEVLKSLGTSFLGFREIHSRAHSYDLFQITDHK